MVGRRKKKLFTAPWYPWYVADVMASENVRYLSLTEEGAYRRALDNAWREGSIPADAKLLAKNIGKSCTEKIANVVLRMFVPHPKNPERMVNPKMEKIRKEQEAISHKKSEAGKLGMAKRWKNKSSGHNTVITPPITNDNHTNTNTNTNTEDSSYEESKTQDASVPAPVREIFIGTVEAELAKRMELKTLPSKIEWQQSAEWAFTNDFTADHFLECYDLLKKQDWRDGPVKPKTVTDNLPNLEKLRKGIEKQNGNHRQNLKQTASERNVERVKSTRDLAARVANGELDGAIEALCFPVDHDSREGEDTLQLAAADGTGSVDPSG